MMFRVAAAAAVAASAGAGACWDWSPARRLGRLAQCSPDGGLCGDGQEGFARG